jgi:hypothetical protein
MNESLLWQGSVANLPQYLCLELLPKPLRLPRRKRKVCSALPIPEAKLREIVTARDKGGESGGEESWKFEISREGCGYRVFAQEIPERVASHFLP